MTIAAARPTVENEVENRLLEQLEAAKWKAVTSSSHAAIPSSSRQDGDIYSASFSNVPELSDFLHRMAERKVLTGTHSSRSNGNEGVVMISKGELNRLGIEVEQHGLRRSL